MYWNLISWLAKGINFAPSQASFSHEETFHLSFYSWENAFLMCWFHLFFPFISSSPHTLCRKERRESLQLCVKRLIDETNMNEKVFLSLREIKGRRKIDHRNENLETFFWIHQRKRLLQSSSIITKNNNSKVLVLAEKVMPWWTLFEWMFFLLLDRVVKFTFSLVQKKEENSERSGRKQIFSLTPSIQPFSPPELWKRKEKSQNVEHIFSSSIRLLKGSCREIASPWIQSNLARRIFPSDSFYVYH